MRGIICLLLPVLLAFGGMFIAQPFSSLLEMEETPEYLKFIMALGGFLTGALISFIISRKEKRHGKKRTDEQFE